MKKQFVTCLTLLMLLFTVTSTPAKTPKSDEKRLIAESLNIIKNQEAKFIINTIMFKSSVKQSHIKNYDKICKKFIGASIPLDNHMYNILNGFIIGFSKGLSKVSAKDQEIFSYLLQHYCMGKYVSLKNRSQSYEIARYIYLFDPSNIIAYLTARHVIDIKFNGSNMDAVLLSNNNKAKVDLKTKIYILEAMQLLLSRDQTQKKAKKPKAPPRVAVGPPNLAPTLPPKNKIPRKFLPTTLVYPSLWSEPRRNAITNIKQCKQAIHFNYCLLSAQATEIWYRTSENHKAARRYSRKTIKWKNKIDKNGYTRSFRAIESLKSDIFRRFIFSYPLKYNSGPDGHFYEFFYSENKKSVIYMKRARKLYRRRCIKRDKRFMRGLKKMCKKHMLVDPYKPGGIRAGIEPNRTLPSINPPASQSADSTFKKTLATKRSNRHSKLLSFDGADERVL